MGESVEVELPVVALHIEGHRLAAVHTTEAAGGIKGAGTAGIVELHLLDHRGDGVGHQKAEHTHGAACRDGHILFLTSHCQLLIGVEGVANEVVGKGDSIGIGDGGGTIAVMSDNHYFVDTFTQGERGLAEVFVGGRLGHASHLLVVAEDGDAQTRAYLFDIDRGACGGMHGSISSRLKGCHTEGLGSDGEIAFLSIGRMAVLIERHLLTGCKKQANQWRQQQAPPVCPIPSFRFFHNSRFAGDYCLNRSA